MTEAVTTYEQVKALATMLSMSDKEKLIRVLQVQIDLERLKDVPKAPGYPEGWFERTYGSLAEDPIELPPQPRDVIE
jgi:hypothetical protein